MKFRDVLGKSVIKLVELIGFEQSFLQVYLLVQYDEEQLQYGLFEDCTIGSESVLLV